VSRRAPLAPALVLALLAAVGCAAPAPGPDLQILGGGPLPRAGDRLPATSAIFDGTTVRLRGVPGETLAVAVAHAGSASRAVALAIDGVAVAGFTVDHVAVNRPSTSMYGKSRGRGRYPDRLTATTGAIASERLAWFDVALTTPGRYAGQLAVGDARFPVELTIEPTARLDVAAAPRVWAYYEPAELGANVDLDTEWRYAELMRGYGVMATPELTQDNWTARQRWVAGARYVPVWLSREPTEVGAEVAAWIARTAGTGVVPFAIPVDEPRTDEKRAKVRALSAAARAAGAGAGRFLYAVTHAPDPRLGDAIDVYIAPGAARDRTLARDRAWTYNGSPGWAGAMVVDDAGGGPRTWGWLAFAYDVPLWYVWDALYWRDRYRRGDDAPPLDLLRDPITFDDGEDRGALDGVLVYPGPRPSIRLAELRRGLLDRALLEALTACAGRAAADAIVAAVVPATGAPRWPRTDVAWEALRVRILDGLATCRAPALTPPG
jgi:hypothetical protein